MKTLKRFGLVAILGMGLISCGGDDDSSSNEPQLDGMWRTTDVHIDGESMLNTLACVDKSTFEFNGSNLETIFYDGENCDEEEIDNGTFTRNGDKLIVTIDGDTDTLDIVKLTATELELKFFGENDGGFEITSEQFLVRQ